MKILFLLTTLFSCSITTNNVKRGERLDEAKEVSVEEFFSKRESNKIKKTLAGNWTILFENEKYVYFAYPLLSFFRESEVIEELFKVSKISLQDKFPVYKIFEGMKKQSYCSNLFIEENKLGKKYSHFENCKAKLEKDSIIIELNLVNQDEKILKKVQIKFEDIK